MSSNTEDEYTVEEQEEIIEEALKANKLHIFMKKEREEGGRLYKKDGWMDDAERFLYFSYVEAKAMNKHSETLVQHNETLNRLTTYLAITNVALLFFVLVQILLIGLYR